jgi:hypothetical protein
MFGRNSNRDDDKTEQGISLVDDDDAVLQELGYKVRPSFSAIIS